MEQRPKYYIEIDVSDRECSRFEPRYSNYGTLIAECLDNASVDIIDQDGGNLWDGPADEAWMHETITREFMGDPDRAAAFVAAGRARAAASSDALSRDNLDGGNDGGGI